MNTNKFLTSSSVVLAVVLLTVVSQEKAKAQESIPGIPNVAPPATVVKNRSPIELKPLEVNIPPAKEGMLPNGSRVFIVEDRRTPLVTVSVSPKAGSLYEAGDKQGVADMVASTLLEGTKSYSADQISKLTDKYGANIGAGAGDERASVTLTCLSGNLAELLPVLVELVYAPVFPEDRVERVRARAQAGATARQSDPNSLASDALRAALYGKETPYGRPSVTSDQIGLITIAEMKSFHTSHFRPDTAIIGVSGDVDAKEILQMLKVVFGSQAKPAEAVVALPPVMMASRKEMQGTVPAPVVIDRPGSAQSVLSFGVPGIRRSDPDYFALLLANRILGGGFNSRLNQKLREEKGYTYGARSSFSSPKWVGIWSASASVRNAVTGEATTDFLSEFSRLQTTPPKQGELDLVKQSLIGNFALTLESPQAVLARSIERYEYDLPTDYWRNYANRVRSVTPADVSRVARKYLGKGGDPNSASAPRVWVVVVGEKSAIEPAVIKATSISPTQ